MTVLDVITIYKEPTWFTAILLGLIFLFLLIFPFKDEDWAPYCGGAIVGLLLVLAILHFTGWAKVPDHREYVVELHEDMSATEFFKEYRIVKTFEYSDAYQVRKIKEEIYAE